MAIKIIREGFLPENKVARVTCTRCNAEFSFTRADCKPVNDPREEAFEIPCPTCKLLIWVKKEKFVVPNAIDAASAENYYSK